MRTAMQMSRPMSHRMTHQMAMMRWSSSARMSSQWASCARLLHRRGQRPAGPQSRRSSAGRLMNDFGYLPASPCGLFISSSDRVSGERLVGCAWMDGREAAARTMCLAAVE